MNKTEQSKGLSAYAESRLANDPPLRAVRAFEAIARLGSVTLAAQELAISPSAVSHQLKVLEGYLQMPLTERQGRRLVLSQHGRNITARSVRRLTCCARQRSIWSSRRKRVRSPSA
jgi:DNA-binding transcriptional LysR family regulator